jgi:hypothetical protein
MARPAEFGFEPLMAVITTTCAELIEEGAV